MTNITASILILVFLAITFIQSAYDKSFHWNDNVSWLKGHFANSILKNLVPQALAIILVLELVAGVLSLIGCAQLFINKQTTFGYYGAVTSAVTLLCLLFGQRVAKDYVGAQTIAIYFIPAIIGVYLLA